MKKRILSLALSAAMALTMLPTGAFAAGDKGKPPVYNKATGCYEISTPDQLLYLSGSWKDGTPRDGHYVLTADIDMTGVFLLIFHAQSLDGVELAVERAGKALLFFGCDRLEALDAGHVDVGGQNIVSIARGAVFPLAREI